GRQGYQGAGEGDRAAQAARPQHHQHRVCDPHNRRCRPLHGARGSLVMAHAKKYRAADSKISRDKKYSMDEAFTLLPEMKISAKFHETVDLALPLRADPKPARAM